MTFNFDVANLHYRESAQYQEPENCLSCDELVNASLPHVFVRDADRALSDDDALVGLLHPECEEVYKDKAARLGIGSLPPAVPDETESDSGGGICRNFSQHRKLES